MTDYKCTNGHDKCNEMNASDTCPYCVPVVVSPRPWIIERDAVGTPVMIRDAEGQIICEDKDYYPLAPSADDMLDIVQAVNENERLRTALAEAEVELTLQQIRNDDIEVERLKRMRTEMNNMSTALKETTEQLDAYLAWERVKYINDREKPEHIGLFAKRIIKNMNLLKF